MLKNETLGILIAVICLSLIFLVFFPKVWNYFVDNDIQLAKDTLKVINEKIDVLKIDQNTKFPIQGPEDWILIAYDSETQDKPDKCYFGGCICICRKNSVSSCQNGACEDVEIDKISVLGDYKKYSSYPNGMPSSQLLEGEYLSYITFPGNLVEIEIIKKSDKVIIAKSFEYNGK